MNPLASSTGGYAGSSVARTQVDCAKEALPLDNALMTMAAATEALDNATERLINRLACVIRPYPVAPECASGKTVESRSALTDDIWKSIHHVNRVIDKLDVLFQNLDV